MDMDDREFDAVTRETVMHDYATSVALGVWDVQTAAIAFGCDAGEMGAAVDALGFVPTPQEIAVWARMHPAASRP